MGLCNSPAIQQGDLTFILRDETDVTKPFIDDMPIKGPATRYELPNGQYETIPGNPGIRRFVYEHLTNCARVLHRLFKFGATISAPKLRLCVKEAEIVGHRCTYKGREVDSSRIQRLKDWPSCTSVSAVREFLGTIGVLRIFIKDFAKHAYPLNHLTKKDVEFHWGEEEQEAMDTLKELATTSPAIRAIDYSSSNEVILSVDSSPFGVGFILSQLGDDKQRYPSRFGSITWNDRESRYSQAKRELFGTFRALKATRLWTYGVRNFVVEVDAKYIKGMLNNPDVLSNATLNRWIAGILEFDFTLRHVPAKEHTAADGLSRRPRAPEDGVELEEDEDVEVALSASCGVMLVTRADEDTNAYRLTTPRRNFDITEPEQLTFKATTDASTAITIPRSEKGKRLDQKILDIERFLRTNQYPSNLPVDRRNRFLHRVQDFFIRDGKLWKKSVDGRHKIYVSEQKRLDLIKQAHDQLGHKSKYVVRTRLLDRFWWPGLDGDVTWFTTTCNECQLRNMSKFIIPPSPTLPEAPLFAKIHIDTMRLPKFNGYEHLVHARCSLSGYPEWKALRRETAEALGTFIFENILCRWGGVAEIVTDNGTPFIAALDWLAEKYHIRHIRISPYNSQANGPIERRHRDVRESLAKMTSHNERKWLEMAPAVFWAERVTISKITGYSPYWMVHGTEPILPFDILEATYLLPVESNSLTTAELIAHRARQLQKREEDIEWMKKRVSAARIKSSREFEEKNQARIRQFNFKPGDLVIVRDAARDKDLSASAKYSPRYFGPMRIVSKDSEEPDTYTLAELDGAVSHLRFATRRIIPYNPRTLSDLPSVRLPSVDTTDS